MYGKHRVLQSMTCLSLLLLCSCESPASDTPTAPQTSTFTSSQATSSDLRACQSHAECQQPDFVCDSKHSLTCVAAWKCGNGVLEHDPTRNYVESCDDANLRNGDGCDANCSIELKSAGQPCPNSSMCRDGICRNGSCVAVEYELLGAPGPLTKVDRFFFGGQTETSQNYAFASNFSFDVCSFSKSPGCVATGAVEVFSLVGSKASYQSRLLPPR